MTRIILLGTLMFAACDNNGVGRKGETCQVRADCEMGLACIFNVCTLDEFKVSASSKGCDYVECNAPQDCIDNNNFCSNLDDDCRAGDQPSCDTLAAQCDYRCDAQRCVQVACDVDADCLGGFAFCVENSCVECRDATTCVDDEVCADNFCTDPCANDFDCPIFDTCVAGVCEDGQCSADRECIALTGQVESICNSLGFCTQPCQSDTECDQANNYNFFSCISGECTYVGCESANECRAIAYGGGGLPDNVLSIDCVADPINPIPPQGGGGGGCTDYLCGTGECIPFTWLCDGFDDCVSGEDEAFCP